MPIRLVARRSVLGRSAGAGNRVRAADRETGGGAGDAGFHQAGIGRNDHGAGSVRRLRLAFAPAASFQTGSAGCSSVKHNEATQSAADLSARSAPLNRLGCLSPANQCAVGLAGRFMTRLSDAPVLILAPRGAKPIASAVRVRSTATQSERWRGCQRQGDGDNHSTQERKRETFHCWIPSVTCGQPADIFRTDHRIMAKNLCLEIGQA